MGLNVNFVLYFLMKNGVEIINFSFSVIINYSSFGEKLVSLLLRVLKTDI